MDKKNYELIGREIYGFKGNGYVDDMKKLIGKVGKIVHVTGNGDIIVEFPEYKGDRWWFSLYEAMEHLVEEESIDLNQLFSKIKQL